jgi:hypothetical protein
VVNNVRLEVVALMLRTSVMSVDRLSPTDCSGDHWYLARNLSGRVQDVNSNPQGMYRVFLVTEIDCSEVRMSERENYEL